MYRSLLAVLLFASPILAADDTSLPYDLQVVVRAAPHRLLTAGFRKQLISELRDGLQAGLGPLATVSIVDASDKPDAWIEPEALDGVSAIGPIKRHFVAVEFVDGRYAVAVRQLDGPTGQASPVVRRAQTPDRAFVGRIALRFIDQDFGPTATIAPKSGDFYRLTVRGGALPGVDWARRLPKGTVFAVSQLVGSPPRGKLLPATYLQAIEAASGGGCDCRLVSRYREPLNGRGPFMAMALGASQGPVKLRFLDGDGLPHQNLQVSISSIGFGAKDPVREQGAVRNGSFTAQGPYDRLAFVRVAAADRTVPIPVAIVDDRVVVSEVRTAAGDEARQQVEWDARAVRQRFVDILRRLAEQNNSLETLLKNTKNRDALTRVTAGMELLDAELAALAAQMQRLREESKQTDSAAGPILDECVVFLREIRSRRDTLGKAEGDLKTAVAAETSPEAQARKENFLSLKLQAEKQYEDADFDGAIATYEEILKAHGERPEIRSQLTQLQSAWKIQNADHQKAREFVYGPWLKMQSLDELRAALTDAPRHLDTLRNAGDRLTARKMFLVATQAVNIVEQAVDEASKSMTDDAKLTMKLADSVNASLRELIAALGKFVQEGGGGK